MNTNAVIVVCAAIIASSLLFILISYLIARKNNTIDSILDVNLKDDSQNSTEAEAGTLSKFVCYMILGAILIGSAAGTSLLIAFAGFNIATPGPIIWGVGAGVMLLFKPLLYKLFNIKSK